MRKNQIKLRPRYSIFLNLRFIFHVGGYTLFPLLLASCGGGSSGPDPAIATPPSTIVPAGQDKPGFLANNFVSVKTTNHFYVSPDGADSNPGTKAAPFKTIARATQSLIPDTTVHVAAGTYSGGITTNVSGTENRRIYFVSDIKWGAKIVPPPVGTTTYAWMVTGDNVTINGFDIDGSQVPESGLHWRSGIFTRSSNVVIENNHIHHIANRLSDCVSAGGGGVVGDSLTGGKNITMDRNLVHNVYNLGAVKTCRFFHGLYMSTSGTIKNNIIHSVGYGGIHLWHDADRVDIINNTVFNTPKAILVGSGDKYNLVTPGDYINVVNNILVDNGYGIIEESDGSGNGAHNFYINNLYYRNIINEAINRQNMPNVSGAIVADPLFVNYDINGNGNYRLQSSSPAIDAGSTAYKTGLDFIGVARPRGRSIDIGAHEF